MKRILQIDVCDYKNNILCNLYDSTVQMTGQAYDVFINYERNGWKELSFSIPSIIETDQGKEDNIRLNYLVADFRLRVVENYDQIDWYIISEPKITHKNYSKTVEVRAGHISQILKTKNLELEFSDEYGNNVGTAEQFLTTILDNTGWTVGNVATFLEDDGSVKVRTMNASSKTGALKLISDLCELFDAKAIYHGNERTVDLLPLNPFSEEYTEGVPEEVTAENAIELHYSKNVKGITRTLNTENLVTRLYAQGSYGDSVTGICNIQTCSHEEYTFTGIQAGAEYVFTDNTGATYYFYVPADADVSGTVVWSKLDPLSRSYVWDEEKEQFYNTTRKRQTSQIPVELAATPEVKINYLPFLMSFDYYRKINLLNDDQFLELVKYQRLLPDLYKESQEAALARAKKEEELSLVAEPRRPFLKLSVSTSPGDVTSESGHLSLKINSGVGDKGVIYRSDYDEQRWNYFSWYVAGELKDNGDPLSGLGSILFIIHANGTWDTAYLEKIYNSEGLIVDDDGNPTHYIYSMTSGGDPTRIVLHANYSDVSIAYGDKFYLFCSNSMSGMLGINMSTDEAIVQDLENQLTVETVKHPVFFSPTVDNTLISQIPAGEYGWLYQSSIRTNVYIAESALYYCNLGNGESDWRRVYSGEELPTFNANRHNGNYFFNVKMKTLWLGGSSKWIQMTTKKDERMSRAFSTVLTLCAQRERIYSGWYEKYTREGSLPVGNYAAKIDYDSFMLFSTDRQTSETITIDTTNSLLYQIPNDTQSVVSITTRTYDTVDFSAKNILSSTAFSVGNIATNGTDVTNETYYRTGYIRVYDGITYRYDVPADTYVYFYDQNKTFLERDLLTEGEHTIVTPVASDIPSTIETIDEYKAGAYWMRLAAKVSSPTNFLNSAYYMQIDDYENKFVVNDKLYTVLTGFEGSGEQLGIDHLMPKLATLADETYGTLLNRLEAAQQAIKDANLSITDVLGDMLREGYWQDNNYAEGDEERLYKDAMDNLKEISKPETVYDIEFLDLYNSNEGLEFSITDETGISWPDIEVTDAIHLIDEDLDISCWGYIDKLNKCYDQEWKTTLEVNTKLSLIDQHDFTDVMSHIADVARQTKARQTLYQRAAALTGSGQLAAQRLSGTINAYINQITGGASNWTTDDNGNMVFVSADGQSAMMLSGNGLCIANSKNKDGGWNWRTAATGKGIVADTVTTGTLSATLIEAGAITTDKLAASVGQELEISSNVALTLFATADGSRPAGSLITGVADEDEDGNPIYRKVESGESYIRITPKTDDNEAQIDIMSGGNVNIGAGSELNLYGSTMSVEAGSYMQIKSQGRLDIQSGSVFTVVSDNFNIDEYGNVQIEGNVTATNGKIAGFTIDKETRIIDGRETLIRYYMYAGNTTSMNSTAEGIYLGTDGINVGGYLKASKDGATLSFDTAKMTVDAATGSILFKSDNTITVNSGNTLSLLSSNASVKIGNEYAPFTIGADKLGGTNQLTDRSYIYRGVESILDTEHDGIYLGTDGIVLGKGVFKVSPLGRVDASDLNITGGTIQISKIVNGETTTPFKVTSSGTLTSTDGTIGGWTIDGTSLYGGSGDTYVGLSTGSYAFWAGNSDGANAKFSVTNAGALTAKSGSVGGWTIGDTYLGDGATLAKSTVGIRKTSTDEDIVFFAGANGSDISTAKFKVTKNGTFTSTLGTIGKWGIDTKYIYSGTSNSSTTVKLDGSSDTTSLSWYNMSNGQTTYSNHMFAFWCGNSVASSAPFSVTKDGVVTIQRLRVNIGTTSAPKYVEVGFDKWFSSNDSGDEWTADVSAAMGKLKFQTIKSIKKSSTGQVTIYYTNNSGGTSSVNFNSADSYTAKWSGTKWVVKNAAGGVVSNLTSTDVCIGYLGRADGDNAICACHTEMSRDNVLTEIALSIKQDTGALVYRVYAGGTQTYVRHTVSMSVSSVGVGTVSSGTKVGSVRGEGVTAGKYINFTVTIDGVKHNRYIEVT